MTNNKYVYTVHYRAAWRAARAVVEIGRLSWEKIVNMRWPRVTKEPSWRGNSASRVIWASAELKINIAALHKSSSNIHNYRALFWKKFPKSFSVFFFFSVLLLFLLHFALQILPRTVWLNFFINTQASTFSSKLVSTQTCAQNRKIELREGVRAGSSKSSRTDFPPINF